MSRKKTEKTQKIDNVLKSKLLIITIKPKIKILRFFYNNNRQHSININEVIKLGMSGIVNKH